MPTNVEISWVTIEFDSDDTDAVLGKKLFKAGFEGFSKAVYVIRLKSPFSINYPLEHTPVLYIGEGQVVKRLLAHRKWIKRLQGLGYSFGLEVAVCSPRVKKNAIAYKFFEAHLLRVFKDTYGSLPLKNKNKELIATNHLYSKSATTNVLGPGSGTKRMWAIQPLPSNPFRDVFERTHAVMQRSGT